MKRLRISCSIRWKQLLNSLPFFQHTRYRRFVILCHARTGSTLLHTYLNSHPHILSLGEFIGMDFSKKTGKQGLSTTEYIEKKGFRKYASRIQAAGFKVFYVYREMTPNREVLDWLENHPEVHIIHLRRENLLRTWVSLKKAEQTQAWTKEENDRDRIHIDPAECLAALDKMKQEETTFRQLFTAHPCLEVTYEALTSDTDPTLTQVQQFLGVQPRKLLSVLEKQHPQPLKAMVENYRELEEKLNNTSWKQFLSKP